MKSVTTSIVAFGALLTATAASAQPNIKTYTAENFGKPETAITRDMTKETVVSTDGLLNITANTGWISTLSTENGDVLRYENVESTYKATKMIVFFDEPTRLTNFELVLQEPGQEFIVATYLDNNQLTKNEVWLNADNPVRKWIVNDTVDRIDIIATESDLFNIKEVNIID